MDEIYYVRGRLDPPWYWPRTEEQKREQRRLAALFFLSSPFPAARQAGVGMARESGMITVGTVVSVVRLDPKTGTRTAGARRSASSAAAR